VAHQVVGSGTQLHL